MVCDASPETFRASARPKSFRRLASTRGFKRPADRPQVNEYGYIRVHEGPEPFATGAQSKLVKIGANTTAAEASKQLGLGDHLTLWLQIGGTITRRLEDDDYPLRLQEEFLTRCGWVSADRRTRLSVDPELRHSLRWCSGPAAKSPGAGLHSGTLWLLKGLVFPQWKPRPAHITGSQLHMFPGNATGTVDLLELSGGCIELCQSKAQRLVIMVRPQLPAAVAKLDTNKDNHVFLGFNSAWERNMWFDWLKMVINKEFKKGPFHFASPYKFQKSIS